MPVNSHLPPDGGFYLEPVVHLRAQHRDFVASIYHCLQGGPLHLDPDRKRRRGAQLSHRDALIYFIPKQGHGAVHPTPGSLRREPPGLVLGSLSTSSALVWAANLLLTLLLTQGDSRVVR